VDGITLHDYKYVLASLCKVPWLVKYMIAMPAHTRAPEDGGEAKGWRDLVFRQPLIRL
jgi:hypothetical protein